MHGHLNVKLYYCLSVLKHNGMSRTKKIVLVVTVL